MGKQMKRLAIIGGGAAGLAAAVAAGEYACDAGFPLEITVFERDDRVGRSILATGNGRCNITNKNAEGYEITRDFFESLGLVLRESGEGRVYPYSNQAATVVNILLGACEKYGVKIFLEILKK